MITCQGMHKCSACSKYSTLLCCSFVSLIYDIRLRDLMELGVAFYLIFLKDGCKLASPVLSRAHASHVSARESLGTFH
jgi:hypothetical protein